MRLCSIRSIWVIIWRSKLIVVAKNGELASRMTLGCHIMRLAHEVRGRDEVVEKEHLLLASLGVGSDSGSITDRVH